MVHSRILTAPLSTQSSASTHNVATIHTAVTIYQLNTRQHLSSIVWTLYIKWILMRLLLLRFVRVLFWTHRMLKWGSRLFKVLSCVRSACVISWCAWVDPDIRCWHSDVMSDPATSFLMVELSSGEKFVFLYGSARLGPVSCNSTVFTVQVFFFFVMFYFNPWWVLKPENWLWSMSTLLSRLCSLQLLPPSVLGV